MSLPISMTTYNRPFNFGQSIDSLERSNAELDNFVIFDDCSKDPEKVKLLNNTDYPVYIDTKNRGTVITTVRAIEHMYHNCCCDYLILLQDDILLSKSWLERGVEIFENVQKKNHRIAFLSLYNRDRACDEKYYIMRQGHPGLVAWIINRKWWETYRSIYPLNDYILEFYKGNDKSTDTKEHRVRNVVDYKLSLRTYEMKWQIAKVGKSLVQHVGDVSSMLKGKDMTYCRSKNFVGDGK